MSKPKPRGDIATRFQPQPDSLAAKPISVYLSKPDDAVVRSLPNRSDWLRTVIHNALVAEGKLPPEHPNSHPKRAIIHFAGGIRANPGLGAGAAIIHIGDESPIPVTQIVYSATNNEAEYTGCIIALEKAVELGCQDIVVYGNNKLVMRHLNAQASFEDMSFYMNQVRALLNKIQCTKFQWISKEQNYEAKQLVQQTIAQELGLKTIELMDVTTKIGRLVSLGDRAQFKEIKEIKSRRDK